MIYNFACKDKKKDNISTSLQDNKQIKTCGLVVMWSFRMEDRLRRNLDLAFQAAVDSFEPVADN